MTLQVCSAQKWNIIAILFGFGVLRVVMEFHIRSIQWNRQLDQLWWPRFFVLFMAGGGVVRAGKRGWKESLRRCSLMILLLEILWERPSSKIIEGQQQNILFKYAFTSDPDKTFDEWFLVKTCWWSKIMSTFWTPGAAFKAQSPSQGHQELSRVISH